TGTTDDNANTVNVSAADAGNVHTVGPFTASVSLGHWSVSGIDVSGLNDGTITFTATATDAAWEEPRDGKAAKKDRASAGDVSTVTDAVSEANQASTSASGTTDDNANVVKVTVSDAGNVHTVGPFTATVSSGSWSVSGMDVSSLNDGSITFTATATDG